MASENLLPHSCFCYNLNASGFLFFAAVYPSYIHTTLQELTATIIAGKETP
jgi:hypothetical protein